MLELPHPPPAAAAVLVSALLVSAGVTERERLGTALLEVLNSSFGLPPCGLKVADRAQLHSTDGSGRLAQATYGYYHCRIPPSGPPQRCAIRIYHRTAVKGQVVSASAFTNTLLHEWVHHFDFTAMRLHRSLHTKGFFSRLRHLRSELPGSAAEMDPEAPGTSPAR